MVPYGHELYHVVPQGSYSHQVRVRELAVGSVAKLLGGHADMRLLNKRKCQYCMGKHTWDLGNTIRTSYIFKA